MQRRSFIASLAAFSGAVLAGLKLGPHSEPAAGYFTGTHYRFKANTGVVWHGDRVLLSSDAVRTINGIDGGSEHILVNVGRKPLILKAEQRPGSFAQRIALEPDESALLHYDPKTQRWHRLFGRINVHEHPWCRRNVQVTVDGRDVTDQCFEADDLAGYALVYRRNSRGEFYVDRLASRCDAVQGMQRGVVAVEKLTGQVRISKL